MKASRGKLGSSRLRKVARYLGAVVLGALVLTIAALVQTLTAHAGRDQAATPKLIQGTQEAVVAPNENLVVEGIPPIPASLAERADRYTNFRAATVASWHPTRREMLVSTRFADTFQIHEVKA